MTIEKARRANAGPSSHHPLDFSCILIHRLRLKQCFARHRTPLLFALLQLSLLLTVPDLEAGNAAYRFIKLEIDDVLTQVGLGEGGDVKGGVGGHSCVCVSYDTM